MAPLPALLHRVHLFTWVWATLLTRSRVSFCLSRVIWVDARSRASPTPRPGASGYCGTSSLSTAPIRSSSATSTPAAPSCTPSAPGCKTSSRPWKNKTRKPPTPGCSTTCQWPRSTSPRCPTRCPGGSSRHCAWAALRSRARPGHLPHHPGRRHHRHGPAHRPSGRPAVPAPRSHSRGQGTADRAGRSAPPGQLEPRTTSRQNPDPRKVILQTSV
jgi:hypothetical protein